MTRKLLYLTFYFFVSTQLFSQTISIVGTGVNGWPGSQTGPEITLSSTDNTNFTISNLVVTTGFVKFRQDLGWTVNWGSSAFPSGTGTQNGNDIPTVAGTYTVNFNRVTGAYSFTGSAAYPSIGIWGPAVDSQNGYAGADIDMTTADGITYIVSGFNFSSGNAYFRQDNATNFVWGSTAFPAGTAVLNGPSISIPGGEYTVTFNKNTGAYNFAFPSIGILGTAIGGFDVNDTDLSTTNGFTYTVSNLVMTNGEVKFRKDNSWGTNWGSSEFPTGTGTQNGNNIPITAGTYNISFDKSNGNFIFQNMLTNEIFSNTKVSIFPNPSSQNWNVISQNTIENIILIDVLGKTVLEANPNSNNLSIDASNLNQGIYFAKIVTNNQIQTMKLIKK